MNVNPEVFHPIYSHNYRIRPLYRGYDVKSPSPDLLYALVGRNQLGEPAHVDGRRVLPPDQRGDVAGKVRGLPAGADLEYDRERARRLLQEAGFTPGADGILRAPDGRPFRFTALTNMGNQIRADILAIIQQHLRRIGIDMQVQILEWGTLLSRINDPQRRDFDAVLIGWVTDFRIDNTDLFHCDKMADPFQWVGYCNPEVDRLLDLLPTIIDREAALPYWHRYQRLIAQDQPYTFIYFQERLRGTSTRIQNMNLDARGDWLGAERWWIATNQRGWR
jgi:peptide/nickel transport system substrate-binding protein